MSQGAIPREGPLAAGQAMPLRAIPGGAQSRSRVLSWKSILAHEGLLLFGALVLSRIAVLGALYAVTSGREFAIDFFAILRMSQDPFSILLGESTRFAHYPPLLPLLFSPFLALRSILPDFIAVRGMLLGFELLAWPFVWFILCRTIESVRMRRLVAFAYLASPMTWITSIVMVQEETAGLFFAAAIGAALLTDRRMTALLLCGVAACSVKIFFLLPLAALVIAPQGRASMRGLLNRALVGGAPVALVYGYVMLGQINGDSGIALARFNPPIMFCVSLWTALSKLVPMSDRVMEYASGVLAAASIVAVMLLARIHRARVHSEQTDPTRLLAVVCAMMLCFFATFYHINPEYYALALPLLLVVFRPKVTAAIVLVGLSLPWAVNFLYGISAPDQVPHSSKAVFLREYQSITSIDPIALHSALLWTCVAFMAALAVGAAIRVRTRPTPHKQPQPARPAIPTQRRPSYRSAPRLRPTEPATPGA